MDFGKIVGKHYSLPGKGEDGVPAPRLHPNAAHVCHATSGTWKQFGVTPVTAMALMLTVDGAWLTITCAHSTHFCLVGPSTRFTFAL